MTSSYEEQNTLQYVAGYIIRKVQRKLETSTHPRKDEMVLLLWSVQVMN